MSSDSKGSTPAQWDLINDRLLKGCRVWDLRERRYRHPDTNKEADFYYLDSRDWVIVLAQTPSRDFILIRQFRCGSDELSWELPGGIIDTGEDPVIAGLRELKEETGYSADSGCVIGRCRPNPAILNNFCYIVLVKDAVYDASGQKWDQHEEIEVRTMPESALLKWASDHKIGHALALNALFFYQLKQKSENMKVRSSSNKL